MVNKLNSLLKEFSESLEVKVQESQKSADTTASLTDKLNQSKQEVTKLQASLDTVNNDLKDLAKAKEAIETESNDKIDKLKQQHEMAIQTMKQATEVAVNGNNELSEEVEKLKQALEEAKQSESSAVKQCETLQTKLEEFSSLNSEHKKLEKEKSDLEIEVAKLAEQLRESHKNEATLREKMSDATQMQNQSNDQNEELERWKSLFEESKTESVHLENECSELKEKNESLVRDLSEFKQTESERDNFKTQVAEQSIQIESFQEEVAGLDKLVKCLKEKNELLETNRDESTKEAEQFRDQLNLMQTNLGQLESSLAEQIEQNSSLREKLAEAISAKNNMDDILEKIGEKNEEHQANLESLQGKLSAFKEAEAKASEYRVALDKQQEEIRFLKSRLDDKDVAVDDMKKETQVYRDQYEGLLEEYQQYLQDLEALQSKSEDLEKWKKLYEAEIAELKANALRQEADLAHAQLSVLDLEKTVTNVEADKAKMAEKVGELEKSLAKEKSLNRELADKIEEQDIANENLNLKERLDNEEKEQDDSVGDYKIKYEEQLEALESLQSENESLTVKLEQLQVDHREELQKRSEQELSLNEAIDALKTEHSDQVSKMQSELDDLKKEAESKKAAEEAETEANESEWSTEKKNMLAVLNEKSRETSQLKMENSRLLQTIAEDRGRLQKEKDENESMTKETVHKLSSLIRDKDMEIEALKGRNESLVEIVQSSNNVPDNDVLDRVTKEKESLEKVIQEKCVEIESLKKSAPPMTTAKNINEKSVIDNSNEIVALKERIAELERKLNLAQIKADMKDASLAMAKNARRRFNSESLHDGGHVKESGDDNDEDSEAKVQVGKLVKEKDDLLRDVLSKDEQIVQGQEEFRNLKRKADNFERHLADKDKAIQDLKIELEQTQSQSDARSQEWSDLSSANER